MKNKDTVDVYWWPFYKGWDLLYNEPTNLLDSMFKNKNKNSGKGSFFQCPAFSGKFKNIFLFTCPIDLEYRYDFSDPNNSYIVPVNENKPFISVNIRRPSALNKMPQFELSLLFCLFSEQPLIASFTPPFFHEPKYFLYGATPPGSYDIGQWLRPYPLEITLWKETGIIKFEKDEPLFYVEFLTDKPINLKRVVPTENLLQYAEQGATSSTILSQNVPLLGRYKTFKKTKMKNLILKEIENNIV